MRAEQQNRDQLSLDKLEVPSPFTEFFDKQLRENNITLSTIRPEYIGRVVTLPFYHRDPFDGLMIAQSLTDSLPIIDKDKVFDSYGIKRFW